jgi:hypothetical protein
VRKLRIFVFDILAPGVVTGWIIWRYPELLDSVIPWLIFGILWHLTFEISDTHSFRSKGEDAYRKWGKRPMTWLLVFAVGGCISLAYWASIRYGLTELSVLAKKPRPSEVSKPHEDVEAKSGVPANPIREKPESTLNSLFNHQPLIERTVKFAVMIPFDTAPDSSPIPLDENPDDPLYRTYGDMVSLAMNGTVPISAREAMGDGQISWHAKSISIEEAPAFLGKLLRYYIFRCIDNLQRNSITVSVGYPAQASAGIEPPNAEPYPYEKLFRELSENVFFRPFLHRPSGDEMAWKLRSVSLPKGTEIKFAQLSNPDKYLVRFQRPDHFKVDFIVENFLGTGVGQVPKRFLTPHVGTTMQWTFFVTMRYTIQHAEDDGFNPNTYAQWLDAIYDGLRRRLVAD